MTAVILAPVRWFCVQAARNPDAQRAPSRPQMPPEADRARGRSPHDCLPSLIVHPGPCDWDLNRRFQAVMEPGRPVNATVAGMSEPGRAEADEVLAEVAGRAADRG